MNSLEKIKNQLTALKIEIHARYGVSKIELFGSYARGEQREGSDLDLLVEFDRRIDLLELVGLEQFIGEQLGVKVDAVPKRSVRPELKDAIRNEAIAV